jgi:hypothetical protein
MDPVPDPLLLRKSGSAKNRTQTSGSVARNSDRYIRVAVLQIKCDHKNDFPQSLKKFAGSTWINADHFLPNPFKFLPHPSIQPYVASILSESLNNP